MMAAPGFIGCSCRLPRLIVPGGDGQVSDAR